MRKLILAACCIGLLSACEAQVSTSVGPDDLVEVKIVGHTPPSVEHEGHFWAEQRHFESWIYEETASHRRFELGTKYGEIGDVFKMKKSQMRRI